MYAHHEGQPRVSCRVVPISLKHRVKMDSAIPLTEFSNSYNLKNRVTLEETENLEPQSDYN